MLKIKSNYFYDLLYEKENTIQYSGTNPPEYFQSEKYYTMGPAIDFPMIMSYKDIKNPNFASYFYILNGRNDVWIASLSLATGFDTGLQFNRMRYYNPNLGRFCQSDLIFLKMNKFNYSKNPVNYTDPLGLYGSLILPAMAGGDPTDNWGVTGCIEYRGACIGACFMPRHCMFVKKENEVGEYYYVCGCSTPQ